MKKKFFLVVALFAASCMISFVGCSEDEENDNSERCWEVFSPYGQSGGNYSSEAEADKRVQELNQKSGNNFQKRELAPSACK